MTLQHICLMRTIAATILFGLLSAPAGAATLDAYLWQNRLMIIFTPALDDRRLIHQRNLNVHAIEGLKERHMVVFAVIGDRRIGPELGRAPASSAAAAEVLRQRFGVAPGHFAIVLVGKDGTEKYRADDLVDPSVIFDIVDGMPMRRREMREQRT